MGDTSYDAMQIRLLVINPNTSEHMTDALKPLVQNLGYHEVSYTFFTCPQPGIPSINSPDDAASSAQHCLPHLIPLLPHHDAFLIACYSQHPLVPLLRAECDKLLSPSSSSTTTAETAKGGDGPGTSTTTKLQRPQNQQKYVLGILEASILTSLALLSGFPPSAMFGIVSTGAIWSTALRTAVGHFLNTQTHHRVNNSGGKFIACETTGLSAVELHELPAAEVRQKMVQATETLARWGCQEEAYGRTLGVVCLGCAGMVGLEEAVREGCVNVMGREEGGRVRIVDGVKAGVGMLVALCRGAF